MKNFSKAKVGSENGEPKADAAAEAAVEAAAVEPAEDDEDHTSSESGQSDYEEIAEEPAGAPQQKSSTDSGGSEEESDEIHHKSVLKKTTPSTEPLRSARTTRSAAVKGKEETVSVAKGVRVQSTAAKGKQPERRSRSEKRTIATTSRQPQTTPIRRAARTPMRRQFQFRRRP